MRTIRKAQKGELNKIINIINTAFIPVRFNGYDIRNSVTRIYQSIYDYSENYCVIEEDNVMVATAGNMFSETVVSGKKYPFSIVGSVSTLPSMQNKGCMKEMINFINNENLDKKVVFSMLTGLRHRYNHFGYEKAGFKFMFEIDKQFAKFQNSNPEISIKKFNETNLDSIYEIFLNNNPFIIRKKEEFIVTLKMSFSEIFVVKQNNNIVGYFTYSELKNKINEIVLQDYSKLPFVIKQIIENFNLDTIKIFSSPFNKNLFNELDKISEFKYIYDELHFKVYDMKRFLEMAISMNLTVKNIQNLNKIIKIEDEIFEIEIKNNKVNIEQVNKNFEKEFTKKDFLRYAFSINSVFDNDNLFPLFLDFENCDLF